MKKKTLALMTAFAMTGMLPSAYAEGSTQKLVEHVHKMAVKYPTTKKVDVEDEYFGTKVSDPYRWLEDDRSK